MLYCSETVQMRGSRVPEEIHGPQQSQEARKEPQQGRAGRVQGVPGAGAGTGPAAPVGGPADHQQPYHDGWQGTGGGVLSVLQEPGRVPSI